MKRNKFKRALHHLNKKNVVESAPTNSTLGVFSVVPSGVGPVGWTDQTFTKDKSGNPLPKLAVADFTVGENPENLTDSKDTSGLFEDDGTIKTLTPPGDNSYILGPMSTMWYAWGNFTTIGYIRQSDRKMVNLGTITGKLSDWNGAAINSYGQLTLEQALWFRDVDKFGGIDNDPANHNYRAFYPGPPSNTPDAFGRYRCALVASREAGGTETRPAPPVNPTNPGEMSPDDNFSAIMSKLMKTKPKLSDFGAGRAGRAAYNRALREWEKKLAAAEKAAGLETENPLFNKDNFDTIKDAASKIANTLWQGAKIVTGAKAAEIIADLTINPLVDAAFGRSVADSAGDYNTKLATSLTTSVITGKPQEISLTPKARKDLINSIDINMLSKHMTIGPTPNPTANNAVNPGKGKQSGLLKGKWGNQGGTHINYDPSNGKFTITSVKMLRDFGDLDQKDAGGKITNFEDIPNPSVDQVKKIFKQKGLEGPLKKFYNTVANLQISSSTDDKAFRPFAGGYDPDEAAEMMYNGLPDMAKALYNFAVEGTASNAVHLRNQLLNAGVPKSDIEKMGAGFGGYVYNQETYVGKDIPGGVTSGVRGVVTDKMKIHLGISESKKLILSEDKKRILREIKKPTIVPEAKKKFKVKPKVLGHPSNKTLSDQMKDTTPNVAFKKELPVWSMNQKMRNARSSQEKKNEVLEYLGSSGDHWEYMTKTIKEHNKKIINLNYGGKKKKVTRKEQVDKDTLVFMEDDFGNKSSVLQSKINEMQAETGDKEMFAKYYEMNPQKKSLFKEVVKRGVFDYPKKPSKKGYPDKEPAKLDPKTGMHPEYGKKYKHDKLDPQSAESMPMQGNPEIDANIAKNLNPESKKRKTKVLNQPNG
tara:strand:- start:54 stop:2672 length:2619 start_codon:yes stop_codon:yes gene_type:complete